MNPESSTASRQIKPPGSFAHRRLCFSALLMDAAMGALVLVTPWFAASRFHMSEGEWGITAMLGTAAYTVGCLALGRLSDRVGSRPLIASGALLCCCVYLLLPHSSTRMMLGTALIFSGLGMSLYWPAVQSWIGRGQERETLNRALGQFNLFWTIGLIIGPAIAGPLYQLRVNFAYYFAALCCLLVIPLALSIHEQTLYPANQPTSQPANHQPTNSPTHPLADRLLLASWIANASSWFMLGCVRHLLQFHAPTIRVDENALSVIVSLSSLVQLITFVVLSRVQSWHYRIKPIVVSQAIAVIGMLIVYFTKGPSLLALGLCLTGICTGMSYTASLFYSTHGRSDPGKKTGFHEGLLAIGLLLGPPVGGALGERFSPAAPFLLCAAVLVAGIITELALVNAFAVIARERSDRSNR